MKQVLIASDDVHTRAWFASAIGSLDVSTIEAPLSDVAELLNGSELDALVIDGARDPQPLLQIVERAVTSGADVRLLVAIEAEALPALRMPSHVATDFIVRGASSEELAARMRGLLWPGEEAVPQELVRVDGLTINLATYQAYLDGQPIDFAYLEYALFAFLVTHPNRAYSREVLLRRVWDSDYYGGSRTVDVHIRRIRSKIGPELSKRLETVRHVGYLWNG